MCYCCYVIRHDKILELLLAYHQPIYIVHVQLVHAFEAEAVSSVNLIQQIAVVKLDKMF